jgi:hypothetical protein
MSFDYNVLTIDPMTHKPIGACDHQQSFERYVVNQDDFRTLNYAGNPSINMRAPINGASHVQMWIRDTQVFSGDPTYGWTVQQDADRVDIATSDVFFKIVFNQPVRIVLPLIEVSYITRQPYCLKCSALGALNDFKPAASGDFLHITLGNKLAQKLLKWVLCSQCPFYPSFTCAIKSFIGKKLGIQIADTDIQTEVVNTLGTMQRVQNAQGTVQTLQPQEILKDIVSVTAATDPNNPTAVAVAAVVSNYSGQTVPTGFTIRMNS